MRPHRHHYDHRVRQAIVATGNPRLFPHLKIPPSTARSWIRRGCRPIVSADDRSDDITALRAEIEELQAKAAYYFAVASVFLVVIRTFKLRLDFERLPSGRAKAQLLRAIEIGSRSAPQKRLLGLIGLTRSRFHAWKRRELRCELDDRSSCPRTRPSRLTSDEVQRIKADVLDPDLKHMSVRALALHAQRRGRVFASPSTWRALICTRGWRRPRARVYPAKPKFGIRAEKSNEWWHLDLTVIRLLSGTKVYLHAAMDNFSRKILAWELEQSILGRTTTTVLEQAAEFLDGTEVSLMTDSGVENINEVVDDFLATSPIRRVLAQVEVRESNSMIEAFWRSLRHQWLYLHELDTLETVRALVAFYVEQHNTVMPHAAFDGATPDDIYFNRPSVVDDLVASRVGTRSSRLRFNRSRSCAPAPFRKRALMIPSRPPFAQEPEQRSFR